MDLNGKNEKVLSQDVDSFSLDENWIYFSNSFNDEYNLYKMDTNGENVTKLNDECSRCIILSGEYVYYTSHWEDGEKLIRIKIDGTQRELVSVNQCQRINLHGNYIYYRNMSDSGNLYRMNLDGSDDVKLFDGYVSTINITDDFIAYARRVDGISGYYMANHDGSNEREWVDS